MLGSATRNVTEPGVWPGVWSTATFSPPSVSWLPSESSTTCSGSEQNAPTIRCTSLGATPRIRFTSIGRSAVWMQVGMP